MLCVLCVLCCVHFYRSLLRIVDSSFFLSFMRHHFGSFGLVLFSIFSLSLSSTQPNLFFLFLFLFLQVLVGDKSGELPLHAAALHGAVGSAALLLGTDENKGEAMLAEPSVSGATALHCAALSDSSDMCAFLLLHGASASCADVDGFTPLHYAASNGAAHAVEALLSASKVDKRDSEGHTALFHAAKNGHVAIVRLLKVFGLADEKIANNDGAFAADYAPDEMIRKALCGVEICAHVSCTRPTERVLCFRSPHWNVQSAIELFTTADRWPIWTAMLLDDNERETEEDVLYEWKLVVADQHLNHVKWENGVNRIGDRSSHQWNAKYRE